MFIADVRAEGEAPSIMHFVLPNRVCIEFKINCTPLVPVEIAVLLVSLKFLEYIYIYIYKQTVSDSYDGFIDPS